MGADQNLIRAAAQMAPKPFDYSGIMKAITAIGQYTAVKNSVASELYAYGDKNISAKDMTTQLFVGDYGDQNMSFISDAKKQWSNASSDIKKYPAFSKKYKTAVKTINNIKTMFEKNKADLVLFEQISKEAGVKNLNKSRGITSIAENRLLDIVLDKETNSMSGSLVFTNQGIGVLGSDDQFISVGELMDGYQANLVDEKVDKKVKNMINEFGYTSANSGQPEFLEAKAKAAIASLVKDMGKNGFAGIRSLAYDLEYNGETFMTSEANQQFVFTKSSAEWDAALEKEKPGLSLKEKTTIRNHQLASAYSYNNEGKLQQDFENWLLGVVRNDFDQARLAPKVKGGGGNLNVGLNNRSNSDMILNPNERPNMIKGIQGKGSWFIDGTMFAWDVKTNQWKYQEFKDGKINDKLQPIPGDPQGKFKDGSDDALLFRFSNDPDVLEALKDGKKSEASSDSTSENKQKKIKDIYDGVKKVEEE